MAKLDPERDPFHLLLITTVCAVSQAFGALCLALDFTRVIALTLPAVVLIIFGFGITHVAGGTVLKDVSVPEPRDVVLHSRRVIQYRTASFNVMLERPTSLRVLVLSFLRSSLVVLALFPMLFLVFPGEVLSCLALPIHAALAATPCVLSLGAAKALGLSRGRRRLTVTVLSLGYCEVELVTDGNAEVSGFWELGSYPVGCGLKIRVGYFPPGVHRLGVRGCSFLFLRTRGFCLLYDADGLPEDREEAFRLARSWEKLSMVYAALCLRRRRSPDPDEVGEALDRVEDNRVRGRELVYLNRRFSLRDLTGYYASVGAVGVIGGPPLILATMQFAGVVKVSPILIPTGLPTWVVLWTVVLSGLAGPLTAFLFGVKTVLRHQRLVRTGRVYGSVLGNDPYEGLAPTALEKPSEDPIASHHRGSQVGDPEPHQDGDY